MTFSTEKILNCSRSKALPPTLRSTARVSTSLAWTRKGSKQFVSGPKGLRKPTRNHSGCTRFVVSTLLERILQTRGGDYRSTFFSYSHREARKSDDHFLSDVSCYSNSVHLCTNLRLLISCRKVGRSCMPLRLDASIDTHKSDRFYSHVFFKQDLVGIRV